MKLIFIRHGDPNYALDTLTEKGWKEAEALAERVCRWEVRDFYVSPLGRARDTAKPSMEKMGRECEVLDWLKEFPGYVVNPKTGEHDVPWDLYPAEWTKDPRYYDKDNWIETELMQSGTVPEMYGRACDGLDELLAKYGYMREGNCYRVERANEETVVCFCHFGIQCVLLSHLLGISPLVLWQNYVALPTGITVLVTEERQQGVASFRCNRFGDLAHLYAAGLSPSFSARFCETFDSDERH